MISTNRLVDVTRGKFIQLFVVTKDDNSNVDRTQDGQFVSLFEQPAFALQKCPESISISTVTYGRYMIKVEKIDRCMHGANTRWKAGREDGPGKTPLSLGLNGQDEDWPGHLHGSISIIFDRLNLDFPSPHDCELSSID